MTMRTKSLFRAFLKILHCMGQASPVLVSVRRISDIDRSRLPEVSKWAMVKVFIRSCAEKHDSGTARVADRKGLQFSGADSSNTPIRILTREIRRTASSRRAFGIVPSFTSRTRLA